MRLVRSFSTSLWRSRQTLYEPYVAPLNEEQKKALRKIMIKHDPHLNSHLSKDILRLLLAYRPPLSTLDDRKQTIARVEHIIKTTYGTDYSIIDRSLYTYARDVQIAPLELAVHDGSRPIGFPPGTEDQPLPDPYRHEALAALLKQHGYTGCFVAGDAERTLPPDALQLTRLQPIEERGDLPVNPPWSSFTPRPVPHLTYPPVLYAEHVSEETMPFFLSPPMPTHLPLLRLLQAYCSLNQSFADLVSLILLWVRSIDLPQLTPTCVALMVIGFLQVQKSVPSLQNPADPKDVERLAEANEGVWVRAEWLPRYPPKAFWLETAFLSPSSSERLPATESSSIRGIQQRQKKLGPLLLDFFRFWSQKSTSQFFISTEQALSVRDGAAVPRTPTSRTIKGVLHLDEAMDRRINQGTVPWMPMSEPVMWQSQLIALPDPFISSYNHAQSISKSAATYFHYFNSLSYRTLSRGHPLATVLGSSLPRPANVITRSMMKKQSSRAYSTGNIGHQARELYESMLPPKSVLIARSETIFRVQKAIKDKFGTLYSVESFGSTGYGVSSAASDLDLVILDPRFKNGIPPGVRVSKLPDVYDVKQVARTLSKRGFTQVVPISKATVPIVKFRDPTTSLSCDLNTNNRLGLWNTRLMGAYCDMSPELVKPMIMIIKQWAKSHGFNDPSGQNGPVTFSSYALALMVIGFLQAKGALPNLQAGLNAIPGHPARHHVWFLRKRKHVECDVRFSPVGVGEWRPERYMQLDEALREWFTFWAGGDIYEKRVLSVREGGVVVKTARAEKKKKGKKKGEKAKTISLVEWQELAREQEEVDAVVAWRGEKQGMVANESEGEAEKDGMEDDLTAESESASSEDAEGGRASGDERVIETRDSTAHVLQDHSQDKDANESGENVDQVRNSVKAAVIPEMLGSLQPPKWQSQMLVVADPFILGKNVCDNIAKDNIELFRSECQRSVLTLECGGQLEDLMGEGKALPGPAGRGKRRQRGGKGR